MSTPGPKVVPRASPPKSRVSFTVAQMQFDLRTDPNDGCWFVLRIADPVSAADRRPLFSGPIVPGMGTQLRRIARRLDDIVANDLEDEQE